MSREPVHRRHHHDELTFRTLYAFSEKFLLSLSHDEVVHMKSSLAGKMPGNDAERLAQLRLLLGYMWAQPGKKLLFMGGELGQWSEWSHDGELDWALLDRAPHLGIRLWVQDLNRLLVEQPALHELDFASGGFSWIDADDSDRSLFSFARYDNAGRPLLAIANFTAEPWPQSSFGVPVGGRWKVLLNSDDQRYGGDGHAVGGLTTQSEPHHGRDVSLRLNVPPFGMIFLRPVE